MSVPHIKVNKVITISEIVSMKNKIKRIKKYFYLPGLYLLYLHISPLFADSKIISDRPDYSNSPSLQFPSDSSIQLPPVELLPERPAPQNSLLNECYYCLEENRQWYYFKDDLIRAIRMCQCDFLYTRIEAAFQYGAIKVYVLFNGKFDLNKTFTVDSAEVTVLNKNSSTHTVLPMKRDGLLRQTGFSGLMKPEVVLEQYAADIFEITSESRCSITLSGDGKKFLAALEFAGSTYMVNNTGIQNVGQEKNRQAGLRSRVSFKIGLFPENIPCTRNKNEQKPDIQLYSVRYFLNQCIADIQVKSGEGIAEVMFFSGSFEKKIPFNGEKVLNSSIPLTAVFDSSTILTIKVTDKKGNVAVARRPVFEDLRDVQIKKKEMDDLQKNRDGWVEKNGVNKTLNAISMLEGNPVSWIINRLIKRNTSKLYQSQADFVNVTGFDTVQVPIRKRFPFHEMDSMTVTASQRIYAELIKRNGTKFQCLEGVSSGVLPTFVDLTMIGVYGKGKFRCFWSSEKSAVQKTENNLFLLCRKAEFGKDGVTIKELPYTIEKTSADIKYSLVYMTSLAQNDTLIYTYVVWFHDRSKETMFRKVPVDIKDIKKTYKNDDPSLRFTSVDNCYKRTDSEIALLSDETLTADKNIYRLDVFAYSRRTDSTFGFGSVWVSR